MTFEEAVKAVPAPVPAAYCKGKQALKENHKEQVQCRDSSQFTGSIDLDACLANVPGHQQANRWDYGIGFREAQSEVAIWIEVHPASTSQVETILQKLTWLKAWLAQEAPELRALTRTFHWVASGGVHIRPGSPQERRLRSSGLDFPRKMLLLG